MREYRPANIRLIIVAVAQLDPLFFSLAADSVQKM
jgi:hypothetical protein